MDEDLDVVQHHCIYGKIDPSVHFKAKTFKSKVILVTGASRGIGRDVARHYALSGASVALVSRHQTTLESVRDGILQEVPDAQILILEADVKDWERAEAVVIETVKHFGHLDILVANAGASTPLTTKIGEKDPMEWWNSFEVNVRGTFNFVRPAIAYLEQTNGYVVATSSGSAQLRFPKSSDYSVSKHAIGRFIEFITLEYSGVKAFAVHPGVIDTELSRKTGLDFERPDPTTLPAATMLYLTSGRADWLSGRYVSSNWDLDEVERVWKDKIVKQDGLVSKLYIPT